MTKKKTKVPNRIYLILLVISTLFMSIGYATVNSVILSVEGTTTAEIPTGVFITKTNYVSDVNANIENCQIISTYQTMMNSNITLSNEDPNSSITYSITLYNSSLRK